MEKKPELSTEEKKKSRYFNVQEHFSDLKERLRGDEVQDACMEDLADYRKIGFDTIKEAVGFFAEDMDELRALARDSEDFLFHLGFKYNKGGMDYSNRYLFPVMNANGELMAWNGYDYESSSKYVIGMLGFGLKKRLLYNVNHLDKCLKEDTIIVVEGLFDSLRLNDMGMYYNSALLGKKMSDYHKKYINRFTNKILIPDGDGAGLGMLDQWVEGLRGNIAVVSLREVEKTVTQRDVVVEKKANDIDDRLREDEEEKKRFKEFVRDLRRKMVEESFVRATF